MTELCKLAAKFGTDKFVYTPLYDLLLGQYRHKFKSVMEIGIGTLETMTHVPGYKPGASLRMWEEFFPEANIFGLDIEPSVLFEEGRIQTRQCNQNHAGELVQAAVWAGREFDLIVDDGSHIAEHQIISVNTLMPFVRPGGLYIIEDVPNQDRVSEQLSFEHTVISHHYTPALVGKLIVIRRPEE